MDRKGEKAGWTWGWLGGFIWVAALATLFFFQGKCGPGWAGIALVALAVAAILCCAPWRFPRTPYWKLMLAPYAVFLLSAVWAFWGFGGFKESGLNWWNFLWLASILSPLLILGRRKWSD